ncbi:MAG TPA: hypothetical protein VFQ74_01190 [Pseudolysinimonas sp.]|nr:hypothetical protein [Pseudolysinimonas sp.]
MTSTTDSRATRRRRRIGAAILTGGMALMLAIALGPASPATAATIAQCSSVDDSPGLGMQCDITVVNTLNVATGATGSSVTVKECHGAANTDLTASCVERTTLSTELVTSVSQCNYAITSGGSLLCSVSVVNNITGVATPVAATVNQCNGSLTGGTVVLRACNPDGLSTTGADITQCNDSDNGGGSSLSCTVEAGSTSVAALLVTINQCNNSANGGGSLIVCSSRIVNNVTAPGSSPPAGNAGTDTDRNADSLAATGTDAPLVPVLPAIAVIVVGASLAARAWRARAAEVAGRE